MQFIVECIEDQVWELLGPVLWLVLCFLHGKQVNDVGMTQKQQSSVWVARVDSANKLDVLGYTAKKLSTLGLHWGYKANEAGILGFHGKEASYVWV